MSTIYSDCRIYVCKTIFGKKRDKCLKFNNISEYDEWRNENIDELGKTSFQPICTNNIIFDQMILAYRNGKIMTPVIIEK